MRGMVYGMGRFFSRFMIYKEKFIPDLDIAYICDNDRTISNNKVMGIEIISTDKIRKKILEDNVDIILVTDENGESIARQLQRMKIWIKIYVLRPEALQEFLCGYLPSPNANIGVLQAIDLVFQLVPPILTRLECEIVDHCNLNCNGCGKLSNIAEKRYLDINDFRYDFERLAELYSNISLIRLLGGEPLLHPELSEFIAIAREIFPFSDIHVVTNGLLATSNKIDSRLFDVMRDCGARFDISMYQPTCKMWFSIKEVLHKEHIEYSITEPITVFSRRLIQERTDYKESFYQCEIGCMIIRDGFISRCGRGRILKELANKFNVDIDSNTFDTGWYNIHDTNLDGWKLNKMLYEWPFLACSYCDGKKMRNLSIMLEDVDTRLNWTANSKPDISDYFYGGRVDLLYRNNSES